MNNKKQILELYNNGYKQINISKIFKISRQRVSQIINNYNTQKNHYLKKKYFKIKLCELCGFKSYSLNIHHKDKNCINNNPNNLMLLCSKCHHYIHKIK
jgi:hypothetical protein